MTHYCLHAHNKSKYATLKGQILNSITKRNTRYHLPLEEYL